MLPPEILDDLWTVKQFDVTGEYVKMEDMPRFVNISADLKKHIEWIRGYIELGFEKIILHNVNREQERFINDFGAKVIQELKT